MFIKHSYKPIFRYLNLKYELGLGIQRSCLPASPMQAIAQRTRTFQFGSKLRSIKNKTKRKNNIIYFRKANANKNNIETKMKTSS